jgi:threonine/homoserine/homoserine lactone efflux protein
MGSVEILTLFGVLLALAAIPSASVVLVVSRSATLGVTNGIAVAVGIVLGDLVYITLAILGLAMVAETMGSLFMLIRYLGGIYLVWFGYTLLTAKSVIPFTMRKAAGKVDIITSFVAGFLLTLGDFKAILFYASLFPLLIDLQALQVMDVLLIVLVTVVSVGGVKLLYAVSAMKVLAWSRERGYERTARKSVGGFLIGVGGYIIAKT